MNQRFRWGYHFQSVQTTEVGTAIETATFSFKDSAQCLKIIVHENYDLPDFCKESVESITDSGERAYSTPNTGVWWNEAQVFVCCHYNFFFLLNAQFHLNTPQKRIRKDIGKQNADVLPLILYSDSTNVSQDGKISMWPIYMTLANIPLSRRKQPGSFQLIGLIPEGAINTFDL